MSATAPTLTVSTPNLLGRAIAKCKEIASLAEPYTYTALRIVVGALFAFHGAQKLLGWYAGGYSFPVFSQVWIGGVIELFGGALIAIGLFTRSAAFLSSGTMAVAYFQFHWKLALARGLWLPAVNMGEAAVIYCFLFLYICARGGGRASIDVLLARARA